MRNNSLKQTEASRKNGSKSSGPRSVNGKNQVRQNALKYGVFSAGIVVEGAGESLKEFEDLEGKLWEYFQPDGQLEEMLVTDIIENWWRRRRVRCAESAELKNQLRSLSIRKKLQASDKIEELKVQFFNLYREIGSVVGYFEIQSSPLPIRSDPLRFSRVADKITQIEGVRQQLASTSQGLEFLIGEMKNIEGRGSFLGGPSIEDHVLMLACCGFGDDMARGTFQFIINMLAGERSDVDKKSFLRSMEILLSSLSDRRRLVRRAEKLEARTRSDITAISKYIRSFF